MKDPAPGMADEDKSSFRCDVDRRTQTCRTTRDHGLVAADDKEFMEAVLAVMSMSELRTAMSKAARKHACRASWSEVFEDLYEDYMTYCPVRRELPAAS
jgi:hypothetical protein